MAMILKVDLDGDVRRLRPLLPENAILENSAKWKAISEDIRAGFQLGAEEELTLRYKDEEGDLCTLVEDTLPDFLAQAQAAGGPVRVTASRKGAAEGAASAPAASPAGAQPSAEQAGHDPAQIWEAWRSLKRAWKGKGKGKMCGWKGHWAEAAGPEEWTEWKKDWKEAKRRWWQDRAMQHEHPLASSDMSRPWQCDGCWASCDDGSAPRYRCTAGCDFDLCGGCYAKKAERDGWQDANEAGGGPVPDGAKDAGGDANADKASEGSQDAMFFKGLMKGKGKGLMKGKAKGMMKGMMKGKGKGMFGKGKFCWGAPEPAAWPMWGPAPYTAPYHHECWPGVPMGHVDQDPAGTTWEQTNLSGLGQQEQANWEALVGFLAHGQPDQKEQQDVQEQQQGQVDKDASEEGKLQ